MFRRIWRDIQKYWMGIVAVILFYFFMHFFFGVFCPMVLVTGFPCPACGINRAILFLASGQLARSVSVNPMGIPVVLFFLYAVIQRYVRGKRIAGLPWILGGLVAAALAVYIIRMRRYFPDRPPYVYTAGSFLERTLPHYHKMIDVFSALW